jgi:uncharacterized membrane protein
VENGGWAAFAAAAPIIQAHAVLAAMAIFLGGLQLALPKGTAPHRIVGYVWVSGLALVALSSFAIHELRLIGPFSPIHLLSIFVLYALIKTIKAAREGRIAQHKRGMVLLYILGLLITGGFTLLPGRLMYRVLFGG